MAETYTAARQQVPHSPPRLMRKKEAAAYCGVSTPTFDKWVAEGAIPASLPRLNKWDRAGIDAAIDGMSGLATVQDNADPFTLWERKQNARKVSGRL